VCLGVAYNMDHEAVPRLSKICDWLLNSSQDHFGLHQGKKCQSDHEVQGPQKTYFKAYIIHGHGPTCFAMGETKKMCSNKKKARAHVSIMNVFGGKEDKDKRRQKNGQT
jgi:hypothetical protein